MRKPSYVLISLLIFLQACSALPFQSEVQPTAALSAAETAGVESTPSIMPTLTIVPTITPSPTIVHFPTQDPNLPTATFAPISIFVGVNTATPVPLFGSIPLPGDSKPGPGFESVTVSESKIFWGICKPNKAKVFAKVEDPKEVASVVIFVQLKSATKEDYTPWSTGDVMFNYRDGTFSYTLRGNEIEGHNHYKSSWIRFQLVATNEAGKEIGRTIIYTQLVALSPCM